MLLSGRGTARMKVIKTMILYLVKTGIWLGVYVLYKTKPKTTDNYKLYKFKLS